MSEKNKKEVVEWSYFSNVKEGQEIYGLVYGLGVVRTMLNGFYLFEVEYKNGQVVPYTEHGIPGCNRKLPEQTIFYPDDVEYQEFDFSPVDKILTPNKIIKLRNKDKLCVRCPSGMWYKVGECDPLIVEDYLENSKYHLFKKCNEE